MVLFKPTLVKKKEIIKNMNKAFVIAERFYTEFYFFLDHKYQYGGFIGLIL